MQIAMIGSLKPNPRVPEFLESELLPIPFFDGQKLPVTLLNLHEPDEADIEDALSSFLKLGRQDRLAISRYVRELPVNGGNSPLNKILTSITSSHRTKTCGSMCNRLAY